MRESTVVVCPNPNSTGREGWEQNLDPPCLIDHDYPVEILLVRPEGGIPERGLLQVREGGNHLWGDQFLDPAPDMIGGEGLVARIRRPGEGDDPGGGI